MSENNKIILYQDDNEIIRVSVRFSDEDLWLTQNQLGLSCAISGCNPFSPLGDSTAS